MTQFPTSKIDFSCIRSTSVYR